MLGFQSFRSANKTLKGIGAMNIIKTGLKSFASMGIFELHRKQVYAFILIENLVPLQKNQNIQGKCTNIIKLYQTID
jgi:hypothetical protein